MWRSLLTKTVAGPLLSFTADQELQSLLLCVSREREGEGHWLDPQELTRHRICNLWDLFHELLLETEIPETSLHKQERWRMNPALNSLGNAGFIRSFLSVRSCRWGGEEVKDLWIPGWPSSSLSREGWPPMNWCLKERSTVYVSMSLGHSVNVLTVCAPRL